MTAPNFAQPIDEAAAAYVRARHLERLIAVWPREIEDYSIAGTEHVIARLRKVANAHRELALADHWSYDTNAHIAVLGALKAEARLLASMQEARGLAA